MCGRMFCDINHRGGLLDHNDSTEETDDQAENTTSWDPVAGKYDVVARKASKHTTEELLAYKTILKRSKCGDSCFLESTVEDWVSSSRLRAWDIADGALLKATVAAQMDAWSAEDEEALLTALQSTDPDACPCDIGGFLEQPCIEVRKRDVLPSLLF